MNITSSLQIINSIISASILHDLRISEFLQEFALTEFKYDLCSETVLAELSCLHFNCSFIAFIKAMKKVISVSSSNFLVDEN